MNADDELSRLLDAERREVTKADDEKRGLARLSGALASAASPMAVSTAPLSLGVAAVWKWSAATGAALLVAGGTALSQAPSDATKPSTAVRVSPPAVVRAPEHRPVNVPPPEEAKLPEAPPSAPNPLEDDAGDGKRDAAFTEELRLVKLAKQEIDSGRAHLAEVWLAQHAERFPRGVFQSERDALRVLVACTADPAAGRPKAADFMKANPRSPLVDRISRACAFGEPAPGEKITK